MMSDRVLTNTHQDIVRELDDLCRRRAEAFPVHGEIHAALSARLVDYCHWLQSRQPGQWQPDPVHIEHAERLTPLLIGGFYKSGTTFVLNLLDGHPALSALPGDAKLLHFAEYIAHLPPAEQDQALREKWIHTLVNPTGLPPFWLFGQDEAPYIAFLGYLDYWLGKDDHSVRRVLDAVARAFASANPARSPEARYWVDKTPTQEFSVDYWLSLYPEVRFIHVVRNPLATLAAMKTMAGRRGRPFAMVYMISQLRVSMLHGLAHRDRLGEARYILVRYEDILSAPPETMQALANRLGIAYDDMLIQPTINGMPSTPNSAYPENRLQGQIQTRSLDRWREQLTPNEIAQIVDALYDEATAYGYDWDDLRPRGLRRIRLRTSRLLAGNVFHPLSRFVRRAGQAIAYRLSFRRRANGEA